MNRLDLPYVLTTAAVGLALFCAGRWTAPTPRPQAVYVTVPVVTAVSEPIPPPVMTPKAVSSAPERYTAEPVMLAEPPKSLVGLNDALMPVLADSAAEAPSARPLAPAVSASAPVVAPKAPPPMPIVLEEIPDNPYKHQKKVAQTPGF